MSAIKPTLKKKKKSWAGGDEIHVSSKASGRSQQPPATDSRRSGCEPASPLLESPSGSLRRYSLIVWSKVLLQYQQRSAKLRIKKKKKGSLKKKANPETFFNWVDFWLWAPLTCSKRLMESCSTVLSSCVSSLVRNAGLGPGLYSAAKLQYQTRRMLVCPDVDVVVKCTAVHFLTEQWPKRELSPH